MSTVRVRDLSIDLRVDRAYRRAVDAVDLDVEQGEVLGIVGASGAGKSTVAWALTGSIPPHARVSAARVEVAGQDVLSLRGEALRRYRRTSVAIVSQEPARELDPTARIGGQVAEALSTHGAATRETVHDCLARAGLIDPAGIARRFPHEVSGGQAQRVVLAMALARRPRLLILDEPATGLDALSRVGSLATIRSVTQEHGISVVLISHDLDLIAAHATRVALMEEGRIVESRPTRDLLSEPAHPSSRRLVAASARGTALRRAPRRPAAPVLEVSDLRVRYGGRRVLDGVDLRIESGETVGLVGETGSGKTTLGRAVAGLVVYTGKIVVHAPPTPPPVQIVWQNAAASLNPRRTVGQTLGRAIRLLAGDTTPVELIRRTGLPPEVIDRMPHQLSGGERQRVVIARAFAGRAGLIVCDEPTSALDAATRETVLDLIVELQEATGSACLFISHDLTVVQRIAHRVAVIRDGRIVETVSPTAMSGGARHAYTQRLVAAALRPAPD